MKPEIITGAEIVIRSLQKESVDFVFGYPGGAVLNIYDAIFKQKYFKHVLVRHEQAAVHAADAFSRATGKVGVALVTSGPGATNAVTGIATAYMDSIPMVIISGQVPTHAIGEDAQLMYKRETEDLALSLKRLKREQENMLDMSPTDANSLVLASDFNAKDYVAKDIEMSVKIRNLEIKLELAKKRYLHLFGGTINEL